MKWHGRFPLKPNKTFLKNFHKRVCLKSRNLALDLRSKKSYKAYAVSIYLAAPSKHTYFKSKTNRQWISINLMFETYYAHVCFPSSQTFLMLSPYAQSLYVYFFFPNNYFNLYWRVFTFIYNLATQIFYQKMKFKGKGYYVYKNYRNVLAFQFGYAHRVKIYVPYLNVKFLSKTSILFFGLNTFDILHASRLFFEKRPLNLFTGRGVRFVRQIVYRKAGKISTYR